RTSALECGSLLPLSFAGSLLPAGVRASSKAKSGSKLPHSKGIPGTISDYEITQPGLAVRAGEAAEPAEHRRRGACHGQFRFSRDGGRGALQPRMAGDALGEI